MTIIQKLHFIYACIVHNIIIFIEFVNSELGY